MVKTLGVRSMMMGAVLFGAGMCSSDTIRYRVAQARADADLPHVSVAYNRDGAYVNGNKVQDNGRIGAPRCDFDSLADTTKRSIAVLALQEQPRILGDYVRAVGADAWRQMLYTTVRPDVERDSLR